MKSTGPQRNYIISLTRDMSEEAFTAFYADYARINQNAPRMEGETRAQALGRLTKQVASKMIGDLKNGAQFA